MLEQIERRLRQGGGFGNFLAMLLTLLTSNWGIAVSALISVIVALSGAATNFFENHRVQIGIGVFLATLWTLIGVLALVDRRKPRSVSMFPDYRYGLTFEGMIPNFVSTDSWMPEPGGLQFGIMLRNFTPGPIKYVLESLDIRLGTRSIPKYKPNSVSGYMARGSGRQAQGEGFPSGSMAEFYGKGPIKGTADFSVAYGPPEENSIRRLKISVELLMIFPPNGVIDLSKGLNIAFGAPIISEDDEPI